MAVLPPDPVFNLRSTDMGAVNCLCFHSSERLFSGTAKGSIYLWDMQVYLFSSGIVTDDLAQIFFNSLRSF